MRHAALQIEVLDRNVEAAGFAGVGPLGDAGLLRGDRVARNGLSTGGVFPWRDVNDFVSREARVFSFHAAGIVPGAAQRVGNAALLQEVLHDRVAPDDRMAGLVLQPRALIFVELRVDFAFQRGPLVAEPRRFLRAFVVAVVNVLNDGLARMQFVGPRNVMEEE